MIQQKKEVDGFILEIFGNSITSAKTPLGHIISINDNVVSNGRFHKKKRKCWSCSLYKRAF